MRICIEVNVPQMGLLVKLNHNIYRLLFHLTLL